MSSPITHHTDLAFAPKVAGGVDPVVYHEHQHLASQAFDEVMQRVATGELGFEPSGTGCRRTRPRTKSGGATRARYDHLVVLGIGGSSLGGRTIQSALMTPEQRRRITFVDNVDPFELGQILDALDLEKTALI